MLGNAVNEKRDVLLKISVTNLEQAVTQQVLLIVEKDSKGEADHEGIKPVMQIEAVEVIKEVYQDFIGVGVI